MVQLKKSAKPREPMHAWSGIETSFLSILIGVFSISSLYGLNIQSFPIWVSNLIGSLAMIGVIVGWFLYGR